MTMIGEATTTETTETKPDTPPAETPPAETPPAETPPADALPAGKPEDKPADDATPTEYKFAAPEGVELAEESVEKLSALARELKLPQEQAQKFVDLAVEHTSKLMARQTENYEKIRDEWVSEIKADEKFGGANLGETVERAKRAITRFGSPKLLEFLDVSGYGDHPEILRLLARVDKATGEDRIVDGSAPKDDTRTAAEIIYGSK